MRLCRDDSQGFALSGAGVGARPGPTAGCGGWRRRCWRCVWGWALLLPGAALAASAFSARQSGLEPPGGPRSVETLPNQSAGRTAEGGMGYTDAYGNTVTPREAETPQPRKRLNPGAYGAAQRRQAERPLPDPAAQDQKPVWNFR